MRRLKIDSEFEKLIPPLSADERAGLEADIVANGIRDPLVLAKWPNNQPVLVDGHNRFAIATKHWCRFETIIRRFASRTHTALWIRENQLSRRNITDDVRAALAEEVRLERSKLAMRDRARRGGLAKAGCLSPTACDKQPRDIRAEVAAESKVSRRKLAYAKELREQAPLLFAKVRAGSMSMMDAMRARRQAARVAAVENLATKKAKEVLGVFDVIVIDPPWPQAQVNFGTDRLDTNQLDYPVMQLADIEAVVGAQLARHAFKNCHVFLWTTQTFLPAALSLLGAWGLRYSYTMTWHKPGGPKPLDLPTFNSEFVLYARKGAPHRFLDTRGFFTCFTAPRGHHSEKPGEFYEMVRKATGGRRLDMFNRRSINGFVGWGIEAPEAS